MEEKIKIRIFVVKRKKKKHFVLPITIVYFLCIAYCNELVANNYYVDPLSNSNLSNGSLISPWKTIAQVNSGTTKLYPGDTVFFRKNRTYTGRLYITRSGNISSPIVYTSYGEGNMPEFDNVYSNIININARQYIIIDGIKIIDKSINPTDHTIEAKISYAININNSPNCTIRNCDISLVGIGINTTAGSDNTTITGNYIHNLRMVRNTPIAINPNDDFGANPIVLGSSNNTISKNRLEECWAKSYDYGYDGGAIEFFGNNMNYNKIMYNTAINCNGFIEIGSSSNGIAQDNIIAYNKIINCGIIGVYQNGKGFTTTIKNIQYYNNTIVETSKKYSKPGAMFWMAGTGSAGMVVLKNNIFWLSSGVNLADEKFNAGQMIHLHNIYRMEKGIIGITIDKTERLSTKDLHFANTNEDPAVWDYSLLPNSTAIDIGINIGYERDFNDNTIVSSPDAGILEFNSTGSNLETKPLSVNIVYNSIDCSSKNTTATATVSGGKPPYTYAWNTIPEQNTKTVISLSTGNYTVKVTDGLGASVQNSVYIGSPEKPKAPLLNATETNCFEPTGKITIHEPMGEGMAYSKDGLHFQESMVFNNLLPGTYTITAKNDKGCISSPTTISINSVKHECGGEILNINTSCDEIQSGVKRQILENLCYEKIGNKIVSISPNQFIYYAIVTAPKSSFCIDVHQMKTNPGFNYFGILQRTQINLWSSECSQMSSGTEITSGQGRICINNAVIGKKYILSVKYEANGLIGKTVLGENGACQYVIESRIGGILVNGSSSTLNLITSCPKDGTTNSDTANSKPLISFSNNSNNANFDVILSSNTSTNNFTLNILGDRNKISTIRIVDLLGRTLEIIKTTGSKTILFGENLNQGLYAVEAIQGINKKVMRILKVVN